MIITRIICLITGFVFGSIPTGFLVARLYGQDLRTMGSGNTGSTNALRSLGKKAGAMTFAGDFFKAIIPLIITARLFGAADETRYLITMYTGLGAVLGHDFSPWLHFKGGKGIASSGGVICFTDPKFFLLVLVSLFGIAGVSGYVSLGSLAAAVIYIVVQLYWIMTGASFGWGSYPQTFDPKYAPEILVIAFIMAGLAIVRHKANIKRLLNGTENKFLNKKK
ncbi:MAG: glycerol-3-phosphate 1-O-acyltransferase PlsY [Eubacteriales bacterium]|nr:glycerol-3-phosphate 1-O-acyltransferase PlsY [Eubacteriales bacterium]